MEKRVFLIVLDSFGIGAEPDAAAFGDEGTNTLGAIAKHPNFNCPNLQKLGLFNIDGVTAGEKTAAPTGSFARLQEQSMGKDTTIGHWEIAGVVSPKLLPTFPEGFPAELIHEFEEKTGHKVLCNKPYSGTQVLKDYGEQAMKENALIVYTSADSVFQVAANEELVPVHELYRYCEIAREMLKGEYGVGRVIARPFLGRTADTFYRTTNRHLVHYEADIAATDALRTVLLDILDTPVSPELLPAKDGEIAQKTEDLVGPYELHDFYLYQVLRFGFGPAKIFRLAKAAFAGRPEYPDNVLYKWLRNFYWRFFAQQFKRSCLPDGPKVGSVTLSPRGDWRMPSDACAALWLAELEQLSIKD